MVELLAPVGDFESLYAAVENGANAVYLGGEKFSARKHAKNFTNKEIKEAVEYCHLNMVEVHVAVNILLDDGEMDKAVDYVKYLYDIGVDAIIVQDLGLASIVLRLFEELPLHASTQMTINNLEGAKLLEKLGFKRVVLARETSYEEIRRIVEETKLEVEVFVHGALCVAYSGQCLMSSLIGGRSGNRGSCAQPCRMEYIIVDRNKIERPELKEKYLLSTRELNTLEKIEKLMDLGIDSFKIEGRMKRPEYVATIVSKYRKAIDKGSEKLSRKDLDEVRQIFNRNFTKGLTFKDFGKSFISYDRPDNRGLILGEIIGKDDRNNSQIKLYRNLYEGDGIEFIINGKYKGMKSDINGFKGEVISLPKLRGLKKGSLIYKTSDIKLLEKARDSYSNRKEYSIDMVFTAKISSKPKLEVIYGDKSFRVENDFTCEEAQKVALNNKTIYKQLSKLGDTNFVLGKLETFIDENSFLPLSVLNELRRDAIDLLEEEIRLSTRSKIKKYDMKKKKLMTLTRQSSLKKNIISIKVSNYRQFMDLDLNKVDRIYFGYKDKLEKSLKVLEKHENVEKYLWTDKILTKKEINSLNKILTTYEKKLDGISVSNLATLNLALSYPSLKIHGDLGLNIFNSYTATFLRDLGLDSMSLSAELTSKQINNIEANLGGNLEIYTYGYLASMFLKTCPMALIKACTYNEDCDKCNFKEGYGLKDRLGKIFWFERKANVTTIYNSVVLMVIDSLEEILGSKHLILRLDFTIENESYPIQKLYYDYINSNIGKKEVIRFIDKEKENREITKGHYFRGIM